MKTRLPLLALLLWNGFCPSEASACRYNVRDIGFVDLETEPYRLYGFIQRQTPPDLLVTLTEIAGVELAESNIQLEIVPLEQQKDHPAARFLPTSARSAALVAVLVSPEGQTLPVTLVQPGQAVRPAITTALRQLVTSPKREEIMRQASATFGVVLLIEGPQPVANLRLREVVAASIKQIETQMRTMPKKIALPPALVVVETAARAQEQVLLWSLGLETNRISTALAAIIYGRARWMGPLMKGEEITERNLTGLMSIIGADCECGLDLSWTSGTRLPVKWDAQQQSEITKHLGFDPENPLVKMEVSRIVQRGSQLALQANQKKASQKTATQETPHPTAQGGSHLPSSGKSPEKASTPSATRELAVDRSALKKPLLLLISVGIVVFGIGLGIMIRGGGRR